MHHRLRYGCRRCSYGGARVARSAIADDANGRGKRSSIDVPRTHARLDWIAQPDPDADPRNRCDGYAASWMGTLAATAAPDPQWGPHLQSDRDGGRLRA